MVVKSFGYKANDRPDALFCLAQASSRRMMRATPSPGCARRRIEMSTPSPVSHPPEGLLPRLFKLLGLQHRHQQNPPANKAPGPP